MGTKTIRLGSTLTFSEEQEGDIIDFIEKLNGSHKTGQFLSNLIRVAMDCPEVLAKVNGEYEYGPAIEQLDTVGMSVARKKFMTQVTRDVAIMKDKVDVIYEQAMKVYALAQMGKRLGIEDRTDSILMATFVCQKQLNQLQEKLGVKFKNDAYVSEKLDTAHKMVDDTLEYILDSYSNIINELKNSMAIEVKTLDIPVNTVTVPVNPVNIPVNTVNIPVNTVNIPVNPVTVPVEKLTIPVEGIVVNGAGAVTAGTGATVAGTANGTGMTGSAGTAGGTSAGSSDDDSIVDFGTDNSDDEEIVDFGESADMGALGNFFGD